MQFFAGTISLATDDPGNTRAGLATGGVFVLTPAAQHLAFRVRLACCAWNRRR
jgi:hypothetical protein